MSRLDRIDLAAELGRAQAVTNSATLYRRQMLALGVPSVTLAMLRGVEAWGYGVVRASAGEDGLYLPGDGPPHLILPVIEQGGLIDLVAFRSSEPKNWRLRTGLGWALGLDVGMDRLSQGHPVPVHETPLDWLRAKMAGIVILDWESPDIHGLLAIPRLSCATPELARMLRAALTRPAYLPQISVRENRLAA